jgi:16S rRNA (uracil1498-N3)-methyltransferase
MPAERFFIDTLFTLDTSVLLEDSELHHLTVMRIRSGDEIELINGKNQFATAQVEKIDKRSAHLQIISLDNVPPKTTKLILAQGIPRFNRLEFILEKGTELGVDEFYLFPAILSEKDDFSTNQMQRMKQLLISAMKQCGRLDLPQIKIMPPLNEWAPFHGELFFGDTYPQAPIFSSVLKPLKEACIFIGPEKGFHDKETHFLVDKLKAVGVKLHHNILRTDTAAIAALSIAGQYFSF